MELNTRTVPAAPLLACYRPRDEEGRGLSVFIGGRARPASLHSCSARPQHVPASFGLPCSWRTAAQEARTEGTLVAGTDAARASQSKGCGKEVQVGMIKWSCVPSTLTLRRRRRGAGHRASAGSQGDDCSDGEQRLAGFGGQVHEAPARQACSGVPPTPLSTAGSATARFARLQVPTNDFGGVWGRPSMVLHIKPAPLRRAVRGRPGAAQRAGCSSRQASSHERVPCARHCDL